MVTATTTEIVPLDKAEFAKQVNRALKQVMGVKGEWVIEPLYELIYTHHGARHENFVTEGWDSELFWNLQRLLWINFSGGGITAHTTAAILRGIGLAEHIPADFERHL